MAIMKRVFGLIAGALLMAALDARADAIDDQYVRIYNAIQEGDLLSNGGQSADAVAKYSEAQDSLLKFQKVYPAWNTKVVAFRLNYLANRINDLGGTKLLAKAPASAPAPEAKSVVTNSIASAAAPQPSPPPVKSQSSDVALRKPGPASIPAPATTPQTVASPPAPKPQPPTVPDAEVTSLKDQLRQLQADKILLEAKLKEALTAMPASTDPHEVAKAEEKVKSLLKENDLLKVNLDQAKSRAKQSGADPLALQKAQKELTEANRRLSEQTEKANQLASERNALQAKIKTLEPNAWNSAALDATRKALEEANRQIIVQRDAAAKLAADKTALQTRLTAMSAEIDAAGALRAENQLLKKQLAELRSSGSSAASPASGALASKLLAEAQAQIAALRSDREILRLEKLALEDRLRKLNNKVANSGLLAGGSIPDDTARIRQIEKERDDLQRKLDLANKELVGRRTTAAAARVQDLESQLTVLRARLEIFEARQVPYSPEELALFKKPETTIAASDPNAGKKPLRELPPGSATLVAEADRYFSMKQYDKAEDRYLQLLRKDERNVPTLANLAAIQLEMNHLDEAEKHITQAVAIAPEDAYSLSIMGYLKFRQAKYDDALDALSKAAKLDPQNAQIQNYLGITLSQKGMRGAAETALRKAIQLEPGYGSAHHNLAVIYATQKPPLTELARWHYQKAINAGHPRNAQLEKVFDVQKTPDEPVQKTAATGAGK